MKVAFIQLSRVDIPLGLYRSLEIESILVYSSQTY
nr:MAG TPA: hypothetical protein [Caudoviricetes sp.]